MASGVKRKAAEQPLQCTNADRKVWLVKVGSLVVVAACMGADPGGARRCDRTPHTLQVPPALARVWNAVCDEDAAQGLDEDDAVKHVLGRIILQPGAGQVGGRAVAHVRATPRPHKAAALRRPAHLAALPAAQAWPLSWRAGDTPPAR
jgi:hypothetical protein